MSDATAVATVETPKQRSRSATAPAPLSPAVIASTAPPAAAAAEATPRAPHPLAALLAASLQDRLPRHTTRHRLARATGRAPRPHTTAAEHSDHVFANRATGTIAAALQTPDADADADADANATAGAAPPSADVTAVAHHVATCLSHRHTDDAPEVLRRIVAALRDPKNGALRRAVISGATAPETLVAMRDSELANPEARRREQLEQHERNRERNLAYLLAQERSVSSLYVCPHCGSERTFADQRVTDQYKFWCSDDGAGILVMCAECGHGWKE